MDECANAEYTRRFKATWCITLGSFIFTVSFDTEFSLATCMLTSNEDSFSRRIVFERFGWLSVHSHRYA